MKLDFRIVQEFGCETPIRPMTLATIFKGITQQLDLMLGTKKNGMNKDTRENRPYNIRFLLRTTFQKMCWFVGEKNTKKTILTGPQVYGMVVQMKIAVVSIVIHHIPV